MIVNITRKRYPSLTDITDISEPLSYNLTRSCDTFIGEVQIFPRDYVPGQVDSRNSSEIDTYNNESINFKKKGSFK